MKHIKNFLNLIIIKLQPVFLLDKLLLKYDGNWSIINKNLHNFLSHFLTINIRIL